MRGLEDFVKNEMDHNITFSAESLYSAPTSLKEYEEQCLFQSVLLSSTMRNTILWLKLIEVFDKFSTARLRLHEPRI